MKSEYNPHDKGRDEEAERIERLLAGNGPEDRRLRPSSPGTTPDVWKRFIDTRLRISGSRGN